MQQDNWCQSPVCQTPNMPVFAQNATLTCRSCLVGSPLFIGLSWPPFILSYSWEEFIFLTGPLKGLWLYAVYIRHNCARGRGSVWYVCWSTLATIYFECEINNTTTTSTTIINCRSSTKSANTLCLSSIKMFSLQTKAADYNTAIRADLCIARSQMNA